MADDPLDRYRRMRDFDRTAEPVGQAGAESGEADLSDGQAVRVEAGDARFVVQLHAARRLHYDVRLEVDGVMASWAVPKGPSYDPAVRRLAVHVEDHPLDYRSFEGGIPGGAYGAGTVIVWDQGTYRNDSERDGRPLSLRAAIDKGHVSVWLEGDKLHGGWHLVRAAGKARGAAGRGDDWLMIKRRDELADPGRDVTTDLPASVQSGRTLEQVAAEETAAGPPAAGRSAAGKSAAGEAAVEEIAAAEWVAPMLARPATVSDMGPDEPGMWLLERKLDGLRCLAVRNGDKVELWSRNRLSYTARFPGVVDALVRLPATDFTIDGELVALDADDRTSFSRLQQRGSSVPVVFFAFDLVHLLGRSTAQLVTSERRALLAKVMEVGPVLRLSEEVDGDPGEALATACRLGWEGLVAKRRDSSYTSGRSGAWRKLKCSASQELVIGGWTEPRARRVGFGAVLVGVHDDTGLRYAGKVGTGFDERALRAIGALLAPRERASSPFVDPVREPGAHWVDPDLVAAVSFTEWTPAGRLRHPSFLGLREDKPAHKVRRETPPG